MEILKYNIEKSHAISQKQLLKESLNEFLEEN